MSVDDNYNLANEKNIFFRGTVIESDIEQYDIGETYVFNSNAFQESSYKSKNKTKNMVFLEKKMKEGLVLMSFDYYSDEKQEFFNAVVVSNTHKKRNTYLKKGDILDFKKSDFTDITKTFLLKQTLDAHADEIGEFDYKNHTPVLLGENLSIQLVENVKCFYVLKSENKGEVTEQEEIYVRETPTYISYMLIKSIVMNGYEPCEIGFESFETKTKRNLKSYKLIKKYIESKTKGQDIRTISESEFKTQSDIFNGKLSVSTRYVSF